MQEEQKDYLDPDNSMFRMSNQEADFKDFDEDVSLQSPENDALRDKIEEEEEKNLTPPDFEDDDTISITRSSKLNESSNLDDSTSEKPQEISHWEETSDDNAVVKKYIVYIARDYVPYIDELTFDERSAYINDALELKINAINKDKEKENKKRLIAHILVAITVTFLTLPLAMLGAHKAIMATFENYKYSQDNFEKLYRQKFEKDKAYMRSVQYNKMLEKKKNK